MAIGVETSPLGHTDAGAAREGRRRPCSKQTWCILADGHAPTTAAIERLRARMGGGPVVDSVELVDLPGGCVRTAPAEHPPADFGPARAVRR